MLRAAAVFSNVSETPEELSFDVGDILTVLEQDVGGAIGWWLCSLNGRTGIAPGNRLRLVGTNFISSPIGRVKNGIDGAVGARRLVPGRQFALSDQIVVPHKAGNVYIYNGSCHSPMDYDVPPALYRPQPNGIASSSCMQSPSTPGMMLVRNCSADYDVPPSMMNPSAGAGCTSNALYDSPPCVGSPIVWNSQRHGGEAFYDIPPGLSEADKVSLSNRSSVLSSAMSTDSRSSFASPRSGNSPAVSARSSIDVAAVHEIYDVPRPSADRSILPPSRIPLHLKQAARDSVLDDYAVPRDTTVEHSDTQNVTPKGDTPGSIVVGGEGRDVPLKRASKTEYDNPVYDIPPNSLNTSGISADNCTVSPGIHSMTSDSGVYDELRSGSNHQVGTVRETIVDAAERFLRLVNDTVKRGEDLSHWSRLVTMNGFAVQTPLQDLIELGDDLAKREKQFQTGEDFRRHLEALNCLLMKINSQLDQLIAANRQTGGQGFGSCSLDGIVESVNTLVPAVNNFCLYLIGHAMPTTSSRTGTDAPARSDSNPSSATSTPVHGRNVPPPPVKPKPAKPGPTAKKIESIFDRPLPAPPEEVVRKPADAGGNSRPVQGVHDAGLLANRTFDSDYVLIASEAEQEPPRMTTTPNGQSVTSSCRSLRNNEIQTETVVEKNKSIHLSESDRELISFYEAQVRSHAVVINSAVADFCQYASGRSGSGDLSSELFVQRAKLVVLAGHKLVYVGDSVARHVTDSNVCNAVASAANELCNQLKVVVIATKEAALLSPQNAVLRLRAVESVQSALAASHKLSQVLASFL